MTTPSSPSLAAYLPSPTPDYSHGTITLFGMKNIPIAVTEDTITSKEPISAFEFSNVPNLPKSMRRVKDPEGLGGATALTFQESYLEDVAFTSVAMEVRANSIIPAKLARKPYYYPSITDATYSESMCGPGIFLYGKVTLKAAHVPKSNPQQFDVFALLKQIAQEFTGDLAFDAVTRLVYQNGKLQSVDFWADLSDQALLKIGKFAIQRPRLRVYSIDYFAGTDDAYGETLAELITDVTVDAGAHSLDIALSIGISQTGVWQLGFSGTPDGATNRIRRTSTTRSSTGPTSRMCWDSLRPCRASSSNCTTANRDSASAIWSSASIRPVTNWDCSPGSARTISARISTTLS